MRSLIIVFLSAFCLLRNDIVKAAPFCDDVKAVLAASANISDLGGRSKSSTSWEAKRNVIGLNLCEIVRLPEGDTIFTCAGNKSRSFAEVQRDYDRLQNDIVACLPSPAWTHMVTAIGQDFSQHGFFGQSDGSSGNVAILKGFDVDTQTMKSIDTWYVALTIYQKEK